MEFNKYFDHTFLKAFATKQDIDTLCQQAKELTAKVCRKSCNRGPFVEPI